MKTWTVPRWFDRHIHLRTGEMLQNVLPSTLRQQATGALIMGNLLKPVSTLDRARAYKKLIESLLPEGSDFRVRLALYLTDHITPEEVVQGFEEDLWCGVKLYMADQEGKGGTTGSMHGVKNLLGRYKIFEAQEKHLIPLFGHFEAVEKDVDEFDREAVSMDRDLRPLLKEFSALPVVVEHVTDGRMADFVAESIHDIHATVTAHHLMINRNAMFYGKTSRGMNPGHFCLPVPKREEHRRRVRKYVTSGNRRFGAGTDSAPHDVTAKSRCYGCAAGIFTAEAAVEMYATVFDEDNALRHLGPFLSENFLYHYGMEVSKENMTLARTPRSIPERVGNVEVFMGGKTLPWTLLP